MSLVAQKWILMPVVQETGINLAKEKSGVKIKMRRCESNRPSQNLRNL